MSAEYKPIPPIGSPVAKLEQAIESRIRYDWMTGPAGLYSMWRYAELMDQSEQWVRKAFSSRNSYAPWQWVSEESVSDPEDPQTLPMPVFNEGIASRMNETSRLSRPRYLPTVRPNGENPDAKTRLACKRMTQAILSELNRMRWTTEADIGHYRLPVHGTWFLKSWWEQRWDETVLAPVKGAVACQCGMKLASPMLKAEDARGLLEAELPEDAEEVAIEDCPRCGGEMRPFNAVPDDGDDAVGRPLMEHKPKGQWNLKTCSPYEMFLPNSGINLRYDNLPWVVECHVEDLDWVALHYPDKAREVKAEEPSKLMEYHPVAGSPMVYGSSFEGAVFNHHVRIKELHAKPFMELDDKTGAYKLNKGRTIIVANGVVLLDTHSLMPSITKPGTFVERAVYEVIPWEMREGAAVPYGLSLWELMCSAQETVNEIASQTAAVRERGAIPYVWSPRSADLSLAEREGIPFTIIETEWSPEDGQAAVPQVIGNMTITDGVYKERDYSSNYMTNVSGRTEVEQGGVPSGVSAATAINILREESGTTRSRRIERIRHALKRLYSHGARLIQAFWIEPRTFEYVEGDRERWDRAKGLDFLGQGDVVLEPEPEFDSEDQRREAVRDLIQLGIDTSTPDGRLKARLIGAPSELFDQENRQELNADREWFNFLDGKRPVMDPTLDDPRTHWEQHGKRCDDERFLEFEERGNWDQALSILGQTWDMDLQKAAMMPPPPMPNDPFPVPGTLDPATGQPKVVPFAEAVRLGLAQQGPPPQSLELRIETLWKERLEAFGFKTRDSEALNKVLIWRAHAEAHRITGEMKQAQAQMAPTMAAPGAEQTASGTEVTPGTPMSTIEAAAAGPA